MREATNINGRTILILFSITTVLYVVMLTVTIPQLMDFSGGNKILDMMPGGYDAAYVTDLLNSLSDEGRAYYLARQLPLDFVYPGMFAVTYGLIFMFFLRKISRHESGLKYFALLPVVAGIADYAENFSIISMIKSFPEVSADLVSVSSTVSVVKSSATTIYFVALVVLLIVVGVRSFRR